MSDEKIVRTYVMSQETVDMLDELTKKEDRNASAIVRRAIEQYYRGAKDE